MRPLTEKDLPLLALILDRDPDLARVIGARLDALEAALASPITVQLAPGLEAATGEVQGPATAPSGGPPSLEDRILAWFRTHPGKHRLAGIRKDLGVDPLSKPFKTALHKLLDKKVVKSTGLKGRGAEYWLA